MAQCFVCHSVSVFRFDLLHRRCMLTHVCLSKHRLHFLCETFTFGKSIFAEFIAPDDSSIMNVGAPKKQRLFRQVPQQELAVSRTF